MQIQYFGLSSFKFTTKLAVVVTDPFSKNSGLTPPRGNADIVVLAEKNNSLHSSTSGLSEPWFPVTDPGEYDIKGVTITGIPLKQNETYVTIFLLESEDIKILNLTHIQNFNIKEEELEGLGDIDVLILPVGGKTVLEPATAAKVVNQIEPSIVIPSHYANPSLTIPLESLDIFTKEMGGKFEQMEKLTLKKKDLTTEGIKIVVLDQLR